MCWRSAESISILKEVFDVSVVDFVFSRFPIFFDFCIHSLRKTLQLCFRHAIFLFGIGCVLFLDRMKNEDLTAITYADLFAGRGLLEQSSEVAASFGGR